MQAGWTFDDVPARLSWRAFFAWLENLPPTSNLGRARDPERAAWIAGDPNSQLLVALGERLDILAWQKTRDGQKGRKRPKPWETPWSAKSRKPTRIGGGGVPMSRFAEAWGDGT